MGWADWTLEYDGTEQTLQAWNFAGDFVLERANQAPDICSISVPGTADQTPTFAYGQPVIIRKSLAGTVYFRGKAILPVHDGSGQAQRIIYRFAGPWWDFERLVFQQQWKKFTGYTSPTDPTSPPLFTTVRASELFLGQKFDGTKQNTGEQITEAVNWAISCGVSVQLGTVDPAVNIPIYNVRDMTVAEVIIQMLRWTPDVVTWFDYTTSPPTLKVRKLANLTNVNITPGTDKVRSLRLSPRYDLQLPSVFIQFKTINTVNGVVWPVFDQQKYPPAATGLELGASVHTIELAGMHQTNVYADLVTAAVNAQSASAATRLAWWRTKEPLLSSPTLAKAGTSGADPVVTSATVTDDAGTTVSLSDYPNELQRGQVTPWMTGVNVKSVTIKAFVTYDLYTQAVDNTTGVGTVLVQKGRTKELTVRINVTNGSTGTYSAVQTLETAEDEPVGLAQSIYDAHSTLRYEGDLTLVNDEIPAGIGMGNKATIVGATQPWSNLLVQRTREEPFFGRLTLSFGVATQLGIADLMELLRVNRYRLIYNMPSAQTSGEAAGSTAVTLGKDTPKENTVVGLGTAQVQAATSLDLVTGYTASVKNDALNKQLVMEVLDGTGARVSLATAGAVEMKLIQLMGSDGNYHKIYFQEEDVYDPSCNPKKRIAFVSDMY